MMIRHDGGRRPQGAAPSIVRSTITEHPRTSLFNVSNGLQDTTALSGTTPPHNEINDLQATTADRRGRDLTAMPSNNGAQQPVALLGAHVGRGPLAGEPLQHVTVVCSMSCIRLFRNILVIDCICSTA